MTRLQALERLHAEVGDYLAHAYLAGRKGTLDDLRAAFRAVPEGDPPIVIGITERQREYLAFIWRFTRKHGFPPSYAEMRAAMGVTNNAIHDALSALQRKGAISWNPRSARTIRVLADAGAAS